MTALCIFKASQGGSSAQPSTSAKVSWVMARCKANLSTVMQQACPRKEGESYKRDGSWREWAVLVSHARTRPHAPARPHARRVHARGHTPTRDPRQAGGVRARVNAPVRPPRACARSHARTPARQHAAGVRAGSGVWAGEARALRS